jgi:hypothetical protein
MISQNKPKNQRTGERLISIIPYNCGTLTKTMKQYKISCHAAKPLFTGSNPVAASNINRRVTRDFNNL